MGCWDYYVAFFGFRWPARGKKLPLPYVLRYLEFSLRRYAPK